MVLIRALSGSSGGGGGSEFWMQLSPCTYQDLKGLWMFIPTSIAKKIKFRCSEYNITESYKYGYCTDITLGNYYNFAQPTDYVQTGTGTSVTTDASTTGWVEIDMSQIPSSAKYICIAKTSSTAWNTIQVVCNY